MRLRDRFFSRFERDGFYHRQGLPVKSLVRGRTSTALQDVSPRRVAGVLPDDALVRICFSIGAICSGLTSSAIKSWQLLQAVASSSNEQAVVISNPLLLRPASNDFKRS